MTSKILHILLLLCVAALPLSAQENPDSLAALDDNFVIASVVIATPGEEVHSAVGHACLRLQCPVHQLDYIFSFEAEDAPSQLLRFFAGDLKMGVRAVPTKEYVSQYVDEGRGVNEYTLNLPIAVKQRLWQQMDERLTQPNQPYDYMNHGCAKSVLSWIEYAIDTDSLQYAPWGEKYNKTRKELAADSITNPWGHVLLSTFIAGEANDPDVSYQAKVMIPSDLLEVLCQAQAYGKPLVPNPTPIVLLPQTSEPQYTWFTPLLAAILLLLLSAVNLKLHTWVLRIPTLLIATLIGLFVSYLVFISDLTCTEWNWLIIPFCPLPLLLWKWRRLWALPYSALILLWCIGILLYPHQLVDLSLVVLSLAVGMVYWEVGRVSHS